MQARVVLAGLHRDIHHYSEALARNQQELDSLRTLIMLLSPVISSSSAGSTATGASSASSSSNIYGSGSAVRDLCKGAADAGGVSLASGSTPGGGPRGMAGASLKKAQKARLQSRDAVSTLEMLASCCTLMPRMPHQPTFILIYSVLLLPLAAAALRAQADVGCSSSEFGDDIQLHPRTCKACLEDKSTALGCGHVTCAACSQLSHCPFCDREIVQRLRIWL